MANKQSGGTRLTGIHPLSYMGVEPVSPPQLVRYQVQPTNRDFNFNIGDLWLVESPFEVWMLLEKPQNVAFWALIYPQGGGGGGISLIHTDAGDVVADVNGEIGVIGGENINVGVSGPNQVVVNLNRTISWPTTNAAGTEGVIYLDGERFLHNGSANGVSDRNTFLGVNSGNFSNTGNSNTGIGTESLTLLTTGVSNTSIGNGSLSKLTTGSFNSALGPALTNLTTGFRNLAVGFSGSAYTLESDNIVLGSAGVAGDAHKLRIGRQGSGVFQQNNTFIAGITGVNTATVSPAFVVNVGTDGELGETHLISSDASVTILQTTDGSGNNAIDFTTAGGGGGGNPFAFSYVQLTDTTGQIDNSTYSMGEEVVLTKLFDVGGNVFPGDGAGSPAVFSAPVTGKYYFEFYAFLNNASMTQGNLLGQSIVTTSVTTPRTYKWAPNVLQSQIGYPGYTLVTDMAMGDTATFTITARSGGINPWIVAGNTGSNINSTRISGFLIPEGASGGNFSQPFLGIQQVDTGNVTGDGTVYLLGSAAPIVEQFDIGNNFDPGDGLGTEASFTAPATGIYVFNVYYIMGGTAVNIVTQTGYMLINGVIDPRYYASSFTNGFVVSTFAPVSLTIGDVVTFSFVYNQAPPALTVKLLATKTVFGLVENTYISGYRIA